MSAPHRIPEAELMAKNVAAMLAGTVAEEALADEAFSELSKLRDRLVRRDFNTAACLVDDAIYALQAACKEFVR